MGPAEFFYRARHLIQIRQWKKQYRKYGIARSLTQDRRPTDFSFVTAENKKTISGFLYSVEPALDFERVLDGQGYALGFNWIWKPDGTCWHIAPDTEKQWPQSFFSEIPHAPGNEYGDIRVAWEPNRLQHLVILGLIFQKRIENSPEKAEQAAKLAVDQMRSWWAENPPLAGINYKSAMECALRIIALCHTVDLIRKSGYMDHDAWRIFLNIVYSHASFVSKMISLYSSLGNHTISECVGLLYAGLLFPEFSEASTWTETALELLEKEADHQILADGGGVEQAIWYLRFVLDLYGCAIHVLNSSGKKVPEVMSKAWERGVDFLKEFEYQPGKLADFGDRDDGWALIPYRDRSLLFDVSGSVKETGSSGIKGFSSSGYTLFNSGQIKVVFDHGPLGMAPSYGHGHADCLSLQVFYQNKPVFIDPGTYCYNCQAEWRSYFRSTMAHNAVTVDGVDQADQQTAFMWSNPFKARLLEVAQENGDFFALACHDGYRRLADPVDHYRGVAIVEQGMVIVWDMLTGSGKHRLVLNWHVDPQRQVVKCDDGWQLHFCGNHVNLTVEGGKTAVSRGETGPISGWHSPVYGKKVPACTISTTATTKLPHEFITIINLDKERCPQDVKKESVTPYVERFRAFVVKLSA